MYYEIKKMREVHAFIKAMVDEGVIMMSRQCVDQLEKAEYKLYSVITTLENRERRKDAKKKQGKKSRKKTTAKGKKRSGKKKQKQGC